ncbi:MAG: ABC transporter ATP-binding protein [Anaerolineae bacterium]|nr:ABC transporter ATP-binding protein [Anaerolineae bacterium]
MSSAANVIPAVRFENVSRHFDQVRAVDNVSIEIRVGEFFSMLGPSGSGKTTCLRLIAGFEQPTSGKIYLHGTEVGNLPPYERDVNTVFQDYALFPHMTVADNVGYALMIKKVSAPERTRRINEALELVRLPQMANRKPSQLSGGQRQRIALARALVNRPRVLLLDEPLGALDLKLRQEMQIELKEIQKRVGITFVFVTHDQEEALTMSDRIAVFNAGKIEQVGSPAEIYEHPATAFVAGFVGASNLIRDELAQKLTGTASTFSIRPEKIRMMEPGATVPNGWAWVYGTVREVVYLGMFTRFIVTLENGGELTVVRQNLDETSMDVMSNQGRRVQLMWQRAFDRVVDAK